LRCSLALFTAFIIIIIMRCHPALLQPLRWEPPGDRHSVGLQGIELITTARLFSSHEL